MNPKEVSSGVLAGKNAVILGGAGEIGLHIATRLLNDSCQVMLVDVSERNLEKARRTLAPCLERAGGGLQTYVGDCTSATVIQAAAGLAAGPQQQLDIAVCVLGGGPPGVNTAKPLVFMDAGDFEKTINYNVTPTLLLLKSAASLMQPHRGGSIVAISSVAAILSAPLMGAYAIGKSALDTLVRLAADELGSSGIRVNAVRPGYLPDPGTQITPPCAYVSSYLEQQPLKRTGTAEDIAAMVHFLTCPQASWITGQSFNVDGGMSLRRIPKREREFLGAEIPEAWSNFLG